MTIQAKLLFTGSGFWAVGWACFLVMANIRGRLHLSSSRPVRAPGL